MADAVMSAFPSAVDEGQKGSGVRALWFPVLHFYGSKVPWSDDGNNVFCRDVTGEEYEGKWGAWYRIRQGAQIETRDQTLFVDGESLTKSRHPNWAWMIEWSGEMPQCAATPVQHETEQHPGTVAETK